MVGFSLSNKFCPDINPLTKQEGCVKKSVIVISFEIFVLIWIFHFYIAVLLSEMFSLRLALRFFFLNVLFCLHFVNEQKEEALGVACCL